MEAVLADLGLDSIQYQTIHFADGGFDPITFRRIRVEPSPAFYPEVKASVLGPRIKEKAIVDTGCTGEAIISQAFANTLKAKSRKTLTTTATLADKTTIELFTGEVSVELFIMGNRVVLDAVVAKQGDPLLIGQPGAKKMQLVIDCGKETLTFANGKATAYRSSETTHLRTITFRRALLQSPAMQSTLLPGDSLSLSVSETVIPDGMYAVQPPMDQKSKSAIPPPQWLKPTVTLVTNNTAKILNGSPTPLEVSRCDKVAEAFPMVDPDSLEPMDSSEATAAVTDDLTWKDVIIDPDQTLTQATRDAFRAANKDFLTVFKPDLPKYNGVFGRLEAVINVPDTMPASARMKEVPWYPRKRLLELQAKFDELDTKGAIVRPP